VEIRVIRGLKFQHIDIMTKKCTFIKCTSASIAEKLSVRNLFVLTGFLILSGTTLYAQESSISAKHRQNLYPAAPDDATLRFVPYYEIEKEEMTCFAFFTED
jgi:hypothetical protein